MYNADNEERHFYVIEYKELIFIFGVFIFIFFALFPKDLLKEQILSKNTDYELSLTYLQNLISKDPKNESLKLILAQKTLQHGNLTLSANILGPLTKSTNNKISTKALLLNYSVLKQKYFQIDDKKTKEQIRKKLFTLFIQIYTYKLYDDNVKKWYEEAVFVNYIPARYYFVQKLIKKYPSNVIYLRDGYALALKNKDMKRAYYYLDLLLLYDKENLFTWVTDKYYLLIQQKKYTQAEYLLNKAPKNKKYQDMLADLALISQQFKKASKEYMILFENAKTYKQKRDYFKKVLSSLVAAKQYNKAVQFAKKYEDIFMKDKQMRIFILKSYLGAGKTNEAKRFSKKILRKGL